jgi:hypothetical protein
MMSSHLSSRPNRQPPVTRYLVVASLFCLALAGRAPVASAQTVNPRVVEFTPSADHNATNTDGSPVVTHYEFEIYLQGAAEPYYTQTLGKPAPETDGKIRVDFSSLVASWGLPVGVFESRVAAEGSGGRTRSTVSNTFQFVTCSVAVSVNSLSAGAAAETRTVGVVAPTGCSWTASSSENWLTLTTASGSGSGEVRFAVSANTGADSRQAIVSVNGQILTVTQAGTSTTAPHVPQGLRILSTQ